MKKIKILLCILGIMMLSIQTSFAEIRFSETSAGKMDDDPRRIISTGRGYFKDSNDNRILYSKDKEDWKDVTDKLELPRGMYWYRGTVPKLKIMETDDIFIMCNIPLKKGEVSYTPADRVGHLIVTDKEFNVIKEIETDRISDISYINGVCYINKYLEYRAEPPERFPTYTEGMVTKQTSYYSTDFENWEVYNEDGGIPMLNNGKEIFVRTDLVDKSSIEHTDLTTKLSENEKIKQDIIYESMRPRSLAHINNYFIALPKDGGGNPIMDAQEKGKLFISKDGVYFTEITLPDKTYIEWICELTNGNLEVALNGRGCYEFPIEDVENTIQTSDIYVQFQDKILGFETPPVIENDSTLVPMRFLFEQMGADVEWNGETQTATATLDNTAVTFAIDDTNAEVNNTPAIMDVPARLINGKTMVPLRFLSENMGYTVDWDAESRTAIINK